jgi:hypothetical protein
VKVERALEEVTAPQGASHERANLWQVQV